ncbi:MAG: M20/M25/M40 family metallo-hydrolase [Cyanobacteria bacterium P01_A01_bin.45]
MKKKTWFILCTFIAVLFFACSNNLQISPQSSTVPGINRSNIQKNTRGKQKQQVLSDTSSETSLNNYSEVSAQRLFNHLENLNFIRYTNPQRNRAGQYITKELQKFGWKPQLENFSRGTNIFAERQGTDKDAKAILIGAHYDTVSNSPGADDNATGVAVMLELARLLGKTQTSRTLQLVFFDKEETGLEGSLAFTTKPEGLKNIAGAVIMDMVGYGCYTQGCQKYPEGFPSSFTKSNIGNFLAVVGDTEHLPLLNAFKSKTDIKNKLKTTPTITLPIPLKGVLTPDVLRSDHAPFWYQGVGAVLITDTANLRTPYYHRPNDIPRNIDRQFFLGAAQAIANATTDLLNSNTSLATPSS